MDQSHPFDVSDIRRLVTEAGFTALSLGMQGEIKAILASLPDWIDEDPHQLARCEALLLFGLRRPKAAKAKLDTLPDDDCVVLRKLLESTPNTTQGNSTWPSTLSRNC